MKKLKDLKISADSVGSLCTITPGNRKLQALARATPYMNLQKRKVLMNAFFNKQFNYCPLIGCFVAVRMTIKLNIYMKDACVLFIMINCLLMKNF